MTKPFVFGDQVQVKSTHPFYAELCGTLIQEDINEPHYLVELDLKPATARLDCCYAWIHGDCLTKIGGEVEYLEVESEVELEGVLE